MLWILGIVAVVGILFWLNRPNPVSGSFDYLGRRTSLVELKQQYTGAKYGELVMEHVKNRTVDSFRQEAAVLLPMIPPQLLKIGESMVDEYVGKCIHRGMLHEDCGNVLSQICDDFKRKAAGVDHQASDKEAFVTFQLITTSAALTFKQSQTIDKAAANRELEDLFDLEPGTLSKNR